LSPLAGLSQGVLYLDDWQRKIRQSLKKNSTNQLIPGLFVERADKNPGGIYLHQLAEMTGISA
jgi:hypothetical protein